ncbi:unnamed protein product, partial [Ectocarpus sp. 8 AP-2014]
MISMQEPAMRVIRLMCLQSATDAGIKASKYDFLKREVVQVGNLTFMFQSVAARIPLRKC